MARGLAAYSFDNRAVTEPHNCTCWVVRIHHPVPHIRIQVDTPLKPNRVSGQKPACGMVKVTVRQQQQPCLPVGIVTPLPLGAVGCVVRARHALTPGVVDKSLVSITIDRLPDVTPRSRHHTRLPSPPVTHSTSSKWLPFNVHISLFAYRCQLLLLDELCNQLEQNFFLSNIIQLHDLLIAFVVPRG
jgi:hypothetical protein